MTNPDVTSLSGNRKHECGYNVTALGLVKTLRPRHTFPVSIAPRGLDPVRIQLPFQSFGLCGEGLVISPSPQGN